MTPFTRAYGGLGPYPREHPRLVRNHGSTTQEDRVTPLSSDEGSWNNFDTPEESMSLIISNRSRGDELSLHGHSDDSINLHHSSQGFLSSLEAINPACPIIGNQDPDGQDSFFTPSSSSASGIRPWQAVALPREDGTYNHQVMSSELESADRKDIDRRIVFNNLGTAASENNELEFFNLDHVQARRFQAGTPETPAIISSPDLFRRPYTFVYDHAFNLGDQSSIPSHSRFHAQNTQRQPPRSDSSDPWTPWRAIYPQDYQPGPQEVMLAPNDALDTSVLPFARPAEFPRREAGNDEHIDGLPLYGLISRDEDTIDKPPSGDPVGPPIENLGHSCFGPERSQHAKNRGRRGQRAKNQGRRGQRAKNPGRRGQLDEETAQGAKIIRAAGACWLCRLLKYKCDLNKCNPSTPCLPCRSVRSQPIFHLPCFRTPLSEFTQIFLPANLMAQHESENLLQYVKQHVQEWTRNTMTVSVTWGYGRPIKVDVNEFKPKGDFLLSHSQYRWNMVTDKYETVRVPSPPIGIVLIDSENWQKKLDANIDREVKENFAGFPRRCFQGRQLEVQKDILESLHRLHNALREKIRSELGPQGMNTRASILVKSYETMTICLKLLMITHIMTRTLTLVENTKQQVYDQLQRRPAEAFGVHTSSRVLNKELKYIMAPLYQDIWRKFLMQVQNTLLVSHRDKLPSWATVLGCLLTLAMTMESVQAHVRCKEATDKCDKVIPEDSNAATSDLTQMEETWEIFLALFHKAYPKFNPIQNEGHRERLDNPSQGLAQGVKNIIEKHREFLESRQLLGPPLTSQDPNNSRLTARLLLSL